MISTVEAGQIAFDFLMMDLGIPADDQEWFVVLTSRPIGESWCVVEIGVEGLPDKWVLQVWDTGECDPNYTFASPIKAVAGTNDLEEMPEAVATAIAAERQSQSP
jgi:hypothetical protein